MDAGSQKYLSAGQMLADSVHVIRFSDSLYHSKHLRIFIIPCVNHCQRGAKPDEYRVRQSPGASGYCSGTQHPVSELQ